AGLAGAALATPAASAAPRARLGDYFTKSDVDRSRRYRGTAYVIGFSSVAVGLAVGAALGIGPGLRRLGRWSHSATGGRWALQVLLLAGVVTLVVWLAQLPFALAGNAHDS